MPSVHRSGPPVRLGAILLLAALWLAGQASVADAGIIAGPPPPTSLAAKTPPEPAPDFPSGYEPDLVRSQLASPDSADVARACGNLRLPWGYRGWFGRERSLRSYGRRAANQAWARRAVAMLLDSANTVDTIYRAPAPVASCRPSEAPPIHLLRVFRGGRSTSVLLRFDLGVATVFADEAPLGLLQLGERADSLWSLLAETLEDDPAFRTSRPVPQALFATSHATGDSLPASDPPQLMGRGREAPDYPAEARRQRIQGTVHVLTRVDDQGRVEDAIIHAGPPLLRDVALETVWGMRFKPARAGGKPVAAWTMVPVAYRVEEQ
jgi:TonB family protein